jgi:hypothetical protein
MKLMSLFGVLLPILGTIYGCAVPSAPVLDPPGAVARDSELDRIHAAVTKRLPPGIRLLSTGRQSGAIVLDLSEEFASFGTQGEREDLMHQLLTTASAARSAPRPRTEEYRILINGVPFEKRIP